MNMALRPSKCRQRITERAGALTVLKPIEVWRGAVLNLQQSGYEPVQIARLLGCNAWLVRMQIEEWEKAAPEKAPPFE